MKNPYCQNCDNDKYRKDGNCSRIQAEDGFIARCTSSWASIKHKIIKDYCYMITSGMRNKFKEINYIDIFAGPGIYFNKSNGGENEGSPLIASKHNFHNTIIVDLNADNINALENRLRECKSKLYYFKDDVNKVAKEINYIISQYSLSFCFVDPNNMGELAFDTLNEISKNKKVDFLINFPYGTDYRRSFKHSMSEHSDNKNIDRFFGTDKWRDIEKKLADRDEIFRANALIDLYINQLESIGYFKTGKNERHQYIFPIHNTRRGLLYYLIFVSKNPRGYDFCKKMRKYAISQQELF